MEGLFSIFIPLTLQLVVLYIISRATNYFSLQRLGRWWFLALTWPGVVVHELSHLIACLLTLTRVQRVSFFSPHGDTLGYVEHEATANPFKKVFISIAPLFGITAMIWLVVRIFFPEYYQNTVVDNAVLSDIKSCQKFFSLTGAYFAGYWHLLSGLAGTLALTSWQTYVFLYLMVALSTHAAPSKKDLESTFGGIAGLFVIGGAVYLLDQWLLVPLTWAMVKVISWPAYLMAKFLTIGIVFAGIGLAIISIVVLVSKVFVKK